MKTDDGTEHSRTELMNIYLSNLNDDAGDTLPFLSIVSSPANKCIESCKISCT